MLSLLSCGSDPCLLLLKILTGIWGSVLMLQAAMKKHLDVQATHLQEEDQK